MAKGCAMSQVVTACLSLCRPKFNPRSVLAICGTSVFPFQQHFTNAPYSYFIFYQLYITLEINSSFIDSFIPLACAECDVCHSEELPPFLSVMYFFQPPFSTNYSSILPHFNLPSISWSTSQSCFFQIHKQHSFGNSIFFHSLYMPKPT